MTDESTWVRKCAGCGALTNTWQMVSAPWTQSTFASQPLCPDCAQRERDHRKEKGE